MFVSLHPCLFDLFIHGLHVQPIAKSGLFIFPTCSLFPWHVIRCHHFSHDFSQFASHFPMFLSCLHRCSACSQPFPACSSIFAAISSIFHFPSLSQPHFPTICPPFSSHSSAFPAFPPVVSPIGQVYTPFRQGQLRAERLADRRHRGLAAGKQVKARGGESLSTVQKKMGNSKGDRLD